MFNTISKTELSYIMKAKWKNVRIHDTIIIGICFRKTTIYWLFDKLNIYQRKLRSVSLPFYNTALANNYPNEPSLSTKPFISVEQTALEAQRDPLSIRRDPCTDTHPCHP